MRYKGSCHCGKVKFEVEGEIKEAMACNCSMCGRRGSLLWFTARKALSVKSPEKDIATYTFNKHAILHRFCATCGIHVFGEGTDPKGNATGAINIRTLEDFDYDKVPVKHFDGKSM